ncbi:proteasome activator complex subunit 3 [Tetranychus urticae]|uniref:Proteasome activator PA28 C-terminal domain-containing protein n=1 Tax=Tetranychus urticae TaxID=32264 RepID=T1JYH1_TETUR|nr:proteasome activator complex subunit 3 [Tetranychus urticae]
MANKNILKRDVPVVPKLVEWNDQVSEKVQKLIKEDFPRKVLAFNDFLAEEYFDEKYIKGIRQEIMIPQSRVGLPNDLHMNHDSTKDNATTTTPRGKKRKAASIDSTESQEETNHKQANTVPGNNKIKTIINMLKPKIKELVEDLNLIKLWVMLLIPRIEDGNNFGVSIQEDILEEVRSTEGEAAIYYDETSKYHHSRAKIISKIAKYPFIEDYRDCLAEIDEKQWLHMKLVVKELRNHYNSLYHLMTKNWEKLICPRSSNSDTMF